MDRLKDKCSKGIVISEELRHDFGRQNPSSEPKPSALETGCSASAEVEGAASGNMAGTSSSRKRRRRGRMSSRKIVENESSRSLHPLAGEGMAIDPRTDKLIRRTAMVGTATAAYLLLTADYGPQDHAILPIKRAIESAESSFKRYIFGSGRIQDTAEEDRKNEKSK